MGYKELTIANIPWNELSPFQQATLELEGVLGSHLNVTSLSRYLAKEECVNERTIRRWIQFGNYPFTQSALERILKITGSITSGDGKHFQNLFSTNLVPLISLPDLETCVERLSFRSHNAMIKAICEEEELPYGLIFHMSFDRELVRKEAKDCLEKWLKKLSRGEELNIDSKYRGVKKKTFQN